MNSIKEYLEHTVLSPTATYEDYDQLVAEALEWQFMGVCVPPYWVKRVKRELKQTATQVVTVIGFPLGYQMSQVKRAEVEQAIKDGADELDVVMNLAAFRSNPRGWVKPEWASIAKVAHESEKIVKVILETAYLTEEEISLACKIAIDSGVDFVKTSTGFAPSGAKVEDVRLMKSIVGESLGVKASGGIKTYEQALAMIEAGAERIGTSSGVKICQEAGASTK